MKHKGFTLLELMIVVAIIGILASIAVPGFMQYLRKAKTSEAVESLKLVADGAVVWFQAEHPNDSSGLTTLTSFYPGCEEQGSYEFSNCSNVLNYEGTRPVARRISPIDANVKNNIIPFSRLHYQSIKPFYYTLAYSSDVTPGASTFTAIATASLLEADDSKFKLSGTTSNHLALIGVTLDISNE